MKIFLLYLASVLILLSQESFKEKAAPLEKLVHTKNQLLNKNGEERASFRLNMQTSGKTAEERARNFLKEQTLRSKRSQKSIDELKHLQTQNTPNSKHIRFQQVHRGLPVYNADVVVSMDKNEHVRMLMTNMKNDIDISDTSPAFSAEEAIEKAYLYLNSKEGLIGKALTELLIYENGAQDKLVYKVNIALSSKKLMGDFELLIDAKDGTILSALNLIKNYHSKEKRLKKKTLKKTDGLAYVFEPDPLARAGKKYGDTGFFDANDSDSGGADSLNNYRSLVTLKDLTLENGAYHLKNDYVELFDFESPSDSFPTSPDPNAFQFTRSEQGFEAVNVFYHIDKMRRYIESLGFTDVNPQAYSGGILCDPHGLNGDDNSHFIPSQDRLAWGEGGVDDAEDADVIWHEFGHAIQDFIVAGFQGNEGLGEGFADYWAESYSRSLGTWAKTDEEYNWVYGWDGHNEFWAGRTTNLSANYPNDLNGAIHHDGQLWSTPLFQVWEEVGREVMDKLVIQSHYYITASANQVANAEALLQASNDLYNGQYNSIIIEKFAAYGQLANYDTLQVAQNLKATSYLDSRVSLSWEKPKTTSPDSYSLEKSLDGSSFFSLATSINELSYTDHAVQNDSTYWYRVQANYGDTISPYSNIASAKPSTGQKPPTYALISLANSQSSADSIRLAIEKNNRQLVSFSSMPTYSDIKDFDGIFLLLGFFLDADNGGNYLMTENEFTSVFKPYLDSGGRIYLEGGDVWAYDPNNGGSTSILDYFNINGLNDGSAVSGSFDGVSGTLSESMSFSYTGLNEYIDHISAKNEGKNLFTNASITRAVINQDSTYKSIGASFEFGGLTSGTNAVSRQDTLMKRILTYFEDKSGLPAKISVINDELNLFAGKGDTVKSSIRIGNLGGDSLHYSLSYQLSSKTKNTISPIPIKTARRIYPKTHKQGKNKKNYQLILKKIDMDKKVKSNYSKLHIYELSSFNRLYANRIYLTQNIHFNAIENILMHQSNEPVELHIYTSLSAERPEQLISKNSYHFRSKGKATLQEFLLPKEHSIQSGQYLWVIAKQDMAATIESKETRAFFSVLSSEWTEASKSSSFVLFPKTLSEEIIHFSKDSASLASNQNEIIDIHFSSSNESVYNGTVYVNSNANNEPNYSLPFQFISVDSFISLDNLLSIAVKEDSILADIDLDSIYKVKTGFNQQDLNFTLESISNNLLFSASVENRKLKLQLNENQNGLGELRLSFSYNGMSNSLLDTIPLIVSAVDDAPSKIGTIEDIVVFLDSVKTQQYRLDSLFADIDSDSLSYSVQQTNSSVLSSSLNDSVLSISFPSPIADSSRVRLTASADGKSAEISFLVHVIGEAFDITINPLGSQSIDEDSETLTIALDTVFNLVSAYDSNRLSFSSFTVSDLATAYIQDKNLFINPIENQYGLVHVRIEASYQGYDSVYVDSLHLTINPVDDASERTLPFSDITQNENSLSNLTINLNNHFSDIDDVLNYSASQSNSNVAQLNITDSILSINFSNPAVDSSRVTVSANGSGSPVESSFLITIIDTDPPSFNYVLHYGSEAALANYLSFYFQYSENLKELPQFTANGSNIAVTLHDAEEKIYTSDYQAKNSGNIQFIVSGKDQSENRRDSSFTVQVTELNSKTRNIQFKPELSFELQGKVKPNHWLYTRELDADTKIDANDRFYALTKSFEVHSTKKLNYGEHLELSFNYQSDESEQAKIGLYRYENEQWHYVSGEGKSNHLKSDIEESGIYAIFYNEQHELLPQQFQLKQNYPNPFNPLTTIPFDLEKRSHVRLDIFNVLGQHIIRLVDQELPQKHHRFTWDSRNKFGKKVSSGIYFYQISAGKHLLSKKMILLK